MKLINANLVVHWEAYDDEHESFTRHSGTIAEFLDQMTDEGCPETVDAVTVRHGRWERNGEAFICSACGNGHKGQPTIMGQPMFEFCPMCGARNIEGDYET